MIESYKIWDLRRITGFCRSADAFQDGPFSRHYTFMFLGQAYPGSRFVLTVRDDEEEWYGSFTRFYSKLYGENGGLPTAADLRKAWRNPERTVWDNMTARMHLDESVPYDRDILTDYYLQHNRMVMDYFRFRDNLLVINVKDSRSYTGFCKFLQVTPLYDSFPWENRT